MSAIERRTKIVRLYRGTYQKRLDELDAAALAKLADAEAAEVDEASAGPRRAGQKLRSPGLYAEAMKIGEERDSLRKEADETAVSILLAEVSHKRWETLAEEHPAREGERRDKQADLNMKTFPAALLRLSLDESGAEIDLDNISQAHYAKLERECWHLHNEDDALPFVSLVSVLKEARGSGSKPQPGSE